MSSQIRSFFYLLLYLAFVYNLDRINEVFKTNLTLFPVLYVTVTLAVIGLLVIPSSIKIPLYGYLAGWGIFYLIGRLLLYSGAPFWTGNQIYQVVFELALLAIAVILAKHVANQEHKIDDLFKKIIIPTTDQPIRSLENSIKDIETEFIRSRRYKHPLSLIVLEPSKYKLDEELDRIIIENQKKISHQYLASQLAEIITRQVRRTDMVMAKDWDGHFVIVCPENGADGTNILAKRIQEDIKTTLGLSIQYGIAAFPTDALTLEELFQRAETNLALDGQVTQFSGSAIDTPV
jgi:GGDEF domain-containing protein